MRNMKSIGALLLAGAVGALLALPGCGGSEDSPTTSTDGTDTGDATDGSDTTDGVTDASDAADGTDRDVVDDTGGGDSTDTEDGSDGSDATDGVDTEDGADATDGTDATDGVLPDVVGGDDAGTSGDDAGDTAQPVDTYVPPTPEEECVATNCTTAGIDPVCKFGEPDKVYPNDCVYNCYEGTYDGATPVSSPDCIVPCLNENCPEDWAKKQPVCVDAGANITDLKDLEDYPNPYSACCSEGNWDWTSDPNVYPGTCAALLGETGVCGGECPAVYSPICGNKDGKAVQYDNSCKLGDCGAVPECNAPCTDVIACPQCAAQAQAACAPLCGTDGVTYRNECYMKCLGGGATKDYDGACCTGCPAESASTLVCDTEGTTHGNDCILNCKIKVKAYNGPCVTGCVTSGADIKACGYFQGAFTQFANADCATKAGATCVYEGDCAEGTNECAKTNQEYDPLCATPVGSSVPQTYANKCNAGCDAATYNAPGLCADCNTLCPPDAVAGDVPHCGLDCVLYPNSCIPTKCIGFELSDLSKNACPASCAPAP